MLLQLDIQNIALIDKVNIEPGKGLNILTGETGAGKSIIIDSINAILGERVSRDIIRTGKDKALVEAVFRIDNSRFAGFFEEMGLEPEEDGTLIISREFNTSGKNLCRINGKMATVGMLKTFGERLIDIHGQFDNQSLLRTESHLELLDSFAGVGVSDLKQRYTALLNEYKDIKAHLKSLSGDKGDRERKIDLLGFQVEEIKKAKLKPGEEEGLNRQRTLLASSEKIINSLANAYELLFSGNNIKNSVSDNMSEALNELHTIEKLDFRYEDICKKLQDLSFQLEDVIEDIRKERDNTEYNPELLDETEERLDLVFKLKRKYGNSIQSILEYCVKAETQLNEIMKSEEVIEELTKRLKKVDKELYEVAISLNAARCKAAETLEGKIAGELEDLEMKRAKFKADIHFESSLDQNGERKYYLNGLDHIEFLISPNAGEPLKPLSKIASGGEMSRIMLAIKTILADVDRLPTLIFDEIDMGISGKASQKVGEKLSFISRKHQVICVTHLAQIACMADSHFLIEKFSDEHSTKTVVKKLANHEIRNEIARILGGASSSEISKKYADEMLINAKELKKA
ncbi:MAG: DNA repair protein RecN [Ruminiclostridium sp.]|nr:DNA repair protein RecN [Ruminiclostridium sp.]